MSVVQISVGQMSFSQTFVVHGLSAQCMSFVRTSVGQMSVDRMLLDQMSLGQMVFDEKAQCLPGFQSQT